MLISHSVRPATNSRAVADEAEAFSLTSHDFEIVQLFAPAMSAVVPLVPLYMKTFLPNTTPMTVSF
jgi:hypothetical protein